MAKQLNVNLAFTANTSQAKKQIQDLQQVLDKLTSGTIKNGIGSQMTADLQKSIVAAGQLKNMIQQAVNPNTGNLDLSRFSEQLKASGKDIQSYAQDLNNLGPEGTKAFMQLAQSVASAEVPMRRTNALVKEFGTTLMNAARWQFSSSALHGLMGAISGAYGYAQDLNKSLTDIAIVTGQSTDQMAEFAEQANKSAQALSVSTTAYTDAALIYYQQGLSDEEVKARTDITMMMSNVTGESAEHVSSYMTAIWNNFAEGSENLTHFADVITALGAATASSSEEIANGMQQFAAVADTVGLSYEYAATALATIVAQTRQSESTVGNGLRTIFSRLQGLKLGDTLEDGTDLNKYSGALLKIGVNIKDQNGNLKEMDTILDEIGAKWNTLAKDQQIALAQTVGGVRQYTNLVALFDNWDTFQENLEVANDSDGALQKQSDTYAEGWEAAQKRVKAAWQSIYQDLIDDKSFITILDWFEKILKSIDSLIDGMGGLKGVLGVIGALITTVFADGLAKGIQNAVYNFKVFTGQAQQDADALAVQFKQVADKMGQDLQSPTATAEIGVLKDQIDFALKLRQASDSITEANKQQLLSLNEITKQYGEAYVEAMKLKEAAENTQGDMANKLRLKVGSQGTTPDEVKANRDIFSKNITSASNENSLQSQVTSFKEAEKEFNNIRDSINSVKDDLNISSEDFANWGDKIGSILGTEITTRLGETGEESEKFANTLENNTKVLQSSLATVEEKRTALKEISDILNEAGDHEKRFGEFVQDTVEQITSENEVLREDKQEIMELGIQMGATADATQVADNAQENYIQRLKQAEIEFENLKGKVDEYSTKIVTCARGMSQLWAAFSAFGKILDTLNDKDLTWADKLKAIIPSLLTGLPMLINSLRTLSGVSGSFLTVLGNGAKIIMANGLSLTSLGSALGVVKADFIGLIGPMLPVIGTIAAVTAGVWLLVEAFEAWKASTPEGQLEAANKRLEEASQKAQEATDAYNELKSTLDEYKKTKEDINNIEDSDERQRAINEENEKILEMLDNIENWHDLIGDLQYDGNGLISLTEEQIKALKNDKAREESLVKQLELQEKINANTAGQNVENSKYSGKQITAKVETLGGQDGNIKQYVNKDITAEVSELLAQNGLNAKSAIFDEDKVRAVLESSGKYDSNQLDRIISSLVEIANDQASNKQFEQMQASQLQTIAENSALEKQRNQMAIDTAQMEMGDKISLNSLSQFDSVQAKIADEWNALDNTTKEAILASKNSAEALQNVLSDRLNIEEANNEALRQQQEEHQAWRDQNINSIEDKVSFKTASGRDSEGRFEEDLTDYLENNFSDEDLKIAATLDLDKYKSITELEAAIEEIKQQTEEDRKFQIEMKRAEDLGLDMDDWKLYVDYLQSVNEKLAENDELAAQVATANMRLNRGVESLVDNFDKELKVIETANKEGNEWSKNNIDYAKALTEIQTALADIGDVDLDTIRGFGEDFVKDNFPLIQEAAQGDIDAIDELIKKIAEAQLMQITPEIKTETFDADRQALINAINETNLNEIEIGTTLDSRGFYDELLKMVTAGEIGANDINKALATIGYTPIVDWVDVDSSNVDEVVGDAQGEMQFQDLDGTTHTAKNSAEMRNYIEEHGKIKIPIIRGSNGGNGQPKIATASSMADALGSSTFVGGTGAQTSPTNRNKGAKNIPKKKGGRGNKGNKGSGKGKERQEKDKKELQEQKKEEDRYHDIEEAVDDLNTTIERLDKNKERAYGKNKINYMNLEIKKLKEQIKLTQKYSDEIKKYQKIDKAALEQKLKDIGMGQKQIDDQFDANGVLKSYEELFAKIQDHFNNTAVKDLNKAREEYNKQVDRWNAGELDEDSWKKIEKALKDAEELYKKRETDYKEQIDALKQYEETINKAQEKQQELLDQQNELFDKALELVSTKIELKLNIADNEFEQLEWIYDNLGDDIDIVTDKIANLGKQAEATTKKIKANADGLRGFLSTLVESYTGPDGKPIVDFSGINMDWDITNPESMLSTINQIVDRMQKAGLEAPVVDIISQLNEYKEGLRDEYDQIREINEKATEEMVDSFEKIIDKLDKNLEENDGFQNLMEHYKNIRDLLGQEQLGLSDKDMRRWNQQLLDIKRDAAQVAQSNYIFAHEAAERARAEYREAVESGNRFAIERTKAMLDEAEEYEKEAQDEALTRLEETLQIAQEMYEQTLEDNERAYQRALGGGILPTLDKLQEQFDLQKELNHLYLDDYEKYKRLGDLQSNINKQLANNPNLKVQEKLRNLTNDINKKMEAGAKISDGEATILEKRLALLQAEDQLLAARQAKSAVRMTRDNEGNFSYTYTADTSKIEEAQQNYSEKFYDLLDSERKYSEDTQAAILASYKEFLEKRNDIINDETLTQEEKEALLNQLEKDMKTKVQFYTDEMNMVMDEMARLQRDDRQDMQEFFGRLFAADDDFETEFGDTMLGKLAPAWEDATDALNGFITAADGLKNADLSAYANWIAENEKSMQNVGSSIALYGEQLNGIYDNLKDKSTEAKEASKDMAEEMKKDFDEIMSEGEKFGEKFDNYLVSALEKILAIADTIDYVIERLSGEDEDLSLSDLLNSSLVGTENSKKSEGSPQKFDTGGYTGDWGSFNGRLAILHQKELVLNEDDTKNLLKSVDLIRSMKDFLETKVSMGNINYNVLAGVGTTDLQQQVHIEASFPNVVDHNEIELALNNLVNSTTQFINRRRAK